MNEQCKEYQREYAGIKYCGAAELPGCIECLIKQHSGEGGLVKALLKIQIADQSILVYHCNK